MISIFPVRVKKQIEKFHLAECIASAIKENGIRLQDNDIIAVSSKFVALSEDRIVKISTIKPARKAIALAKRFSMDPCFAQLVINDSEKIFSGIEHFLLAIKHGVIAPNAGIDRSNIYPGYAILYPKDPFLSAENLRKDIRNKTGKNIGIVITDSRLMPTRIGTTGIALAAAGFEPVKNEIGRKDLFGNRLKYTKRNLADDMAAAAQMLMGEADERIPVVVLRAKNPDWKYTNRKIRKEEMAIDWKKDIYIRGLSNKK